VAVRKSCKPAAQHAAHYVREILLSFRSSGAATEILCKDCHAGFLGAARSRTLPGPPTAACFKETVVEAALVGQGLPARPVQLSDPLLPPSRQPVEGKHRLVSLESGWKIARLLAWTFSYPPALMKEDIHDTVRFLEARHGLHLSATYRMLRACR
jgi:hypothetical protein